MLYFILIHAALMSLHGPEYPGYKPTPVDHIVDTVFRCTQQYSAAHILVHMINAGFPVSCTASYLCIRL